MINFYKPSLEVWLANPPNLQPNLQPCGSAIGIESVEWFTGWNRETTEVEDISHHDVLKCETLSLDTKTHMQRNTRVLPFAKVRFVHRHTSINIIYTPCRCLICTYTCMLNYRIDIRSHEDMHAEITWKHRWNRRLEDPRIPRSMPPIPWRCGLVVKLADGMMFFLGGGEVVEWWITELRNSVIRDSEGLSAAWRLSSPGWFDIDLPREVVQGPGYLARHPPRVSSNKQRWLPNLSPWVSIVSILFYEFGLVSHIQSLFQQLLLDFWDQTIIEGAPHHQVQSDDVHQPSVSWLQKSQQWFKVKLLTVRNWSAVSSLLLDTDVLF